ncbi:MAG: phytanoyl-CoA dioxygenase family protein [Planctomycetota bacterium]|nr:phytanoyl-CoA dioxygenase family protein [Planctomycetota bacterium]MDA1141792.1 phytanoyl-CoA dioxygenase family protein [Planctomycetota bacterium]
MDFKQLKSDSPYCINKNLGSALHIPPGHMTQANADGLPVVELTQKQKYDFDRKGWLLVPGILHDDELTEMREFCMRLRDEPETVLEHERCGLGGPLQRLADHPVVVGFLNEFLAYPALTSLECYGFRLETSQVVHRSVNGDRGTFSPHNGSGLYRFSGDSHIYRMFPGKAWSGLTRVIWELNPVKKGRGGTMVVSGSHKSAFPAPNSARDPSSPLWDTYSCPAGSVILFTESITHSAGEWADETGDRIAVFNLYNTVTTRWHHWSPEAKLLDSMPPKRQTLFRGTFTDSNVVGGDYNGMTSPYMP